MERFCKVGQPMRLTANNYFSPPLGTIGATLWFGLRSRFARGLPICSMRPPFITTTRRGERHGRASKGAHDRALVVLHEMGGIWHRGCQQRGHFTAPPVMPLMNRSRKRL